MEMVFAAGRRRRAQGCGERRDLFFGERPLAVAPLFHIEVEHDDRIRQGPTDPSRRIFREAFADGRFVGRPIIETMMGQRFLARFAREYARADARIGERGVERRFLDTIQKCGDLGDGGSRRVEPRWRLTELATELGALLLVTSSPFPVEIDRAVVIVVVSHGRTPRPAIDARRRPCYATLAYDVSHAPPGSPVGRSFSQPSSVIAFSSQS
jgi:hypothetical protein